MPPRRQRRGRRHGGNPMSQEEKFLMRVQQLITATLAANTRSDIRSVRDEAAAMGRSQTYVNLFSTNPIQGVGMLSYALQERNGLLATCLLEYLHFDASSRLHDLAGRTPLHYAATSGYIDLMDTLVNTYHVDVNATDSLGIRPLHLAILNDRTDAMRELMRLGAIVEGNTRFGKAIHAAAYLGRLEAVQTIHHNFPNELNIAIAGNFTPLVCSLFSTSIDCQKFLAGVSDVATLPLITKVALIKTNEAEAHALMETLLNHGADVNILDQNLFEEPALVIAAKKKWNRVINLLFGRTTQIAGIEDWNTAALLNHVQTQDFLDQDLARKANKVQQLRSRIIVELEAKNVVIAACLCKALKPDMNEWDWSNIKSMCDLCEYWGRTSLEFEQYELAHSAVKACLALEPDNQEHLEILTIVERLIEESVTAISHSIFSEWAFAGKLSVSVFDDNVSGIHLSQLLGTV